MESGVIVVVVVPVVATFNCSGTMCLRFVEEEANRLGGSYEPQSSGDEVVLSRQQHLMTSSYISMAQNTREEFHGGGGTTSSTSVETSAYTDGEGTDNNSGSVAATTPFRPELVAMDGLSLWWMRQSSSYPSYHSEAKQSSDDDEMEQGSLDEMKESTSEEMDHQKSLGGGAAVQSKLCPRGHWRPAEDEKLRELVSQYGPQNWNLIAEKLHGRSGRCLRIITNAIDLALCITLSRIVVRRHELLGCLMF